MFKAIKNVVYKNTTSGWIQHRVCALPGDAALMVRELNAIYPA